MLPFRLRLDVLRVFAGLFAQGLSRQRRRAVAHELERALDRALREIDDDERNNLVVASTPLAAGMDLDFWRIAMRPGKPLMVGSLGPARVLGLPGNPVASFVTFVHVVRPTILALSGDISPAEALAKVERAFGDIPPGPPVSPEGLGQADADTHRVIHVTGVTVA